MPKIKPLKEQVIEATLYIIAAVATALFFSACAIVIFIALALVF